MVDKVDEYDPTKKSGRLRPQSKTTFKQRMAKVDEYFNLDPKVRSKLRKDKYDSLSDTQKKTLSGVKTAAQVASYFVPGGALRLAIPVVRGIQVAKAGKTLQKARDAKNKLQKVVKVNTNLTSKTKGGKSKKILDKEKTEEASKLATKKLKTAAANKIAKQKKNFTAQQNKTTKNLKSASNVALAGGALIAASNARSKKEKLSPGAFGGRVKASPSIKRKGRTNQEKRLAKFASENIAATNRKQNSNGIAAPSKASTKRPASIIAGSGKGLGTLSQIASKYGTTVKELMKANKEITNANVIKKGQEIDLGKVVKNRKSVYQKKSGGPVVKKMGGGKVYRRGGGRALRGMGKAIYSNKMY